MAADLLDYLRGMGGPERDIEIGIQTIHSYTTLVSEMGMEVLTAPMDPALSQALDEQKYRRILGLAVQRTAGGRAGYLPDLIEGVRYSRENRPIFSMPPWGCWLRWGSRLAS